MTGPSSSRATNAGSSRAQALSTKGQALPAVRVIPAQCHPVGIVKAPIVRDKSGRNANVSLVRPEAKVVPGRIVGHEFGPHEAGDLRDSLGGRPASAP